MKNQINPLKDTYKYAGNMYTPRFEKNLADVRPIVYKNGERYSVVATTPDPVNILPMHIRPADAGPYMEKDWKCNGVRIETLMS